MYLFDVYSDYSDIYKNSHGRVQKVTVHRPWGQLQSQVYASQEKTILLFDESLFTYHLFHIERTATTPFARREYRQIVQKKIDELASASGVSRDLVCAQMEHGRVNGEVSEYLIGAVGTISFDLCCTILDMQLQRVLGYKHIARYPRRSFLFRHPFVARASRMCVLLVQKHQTRLFLVSRGWYEEIHMLNGGDDLLWQAYEQAGIDPELVRRKDFESSTLGEKLIMKAHDEYVGVLMKWLEEHIQERMDTLLLSRLIHKRFFVQKISEAYTSCFHGRLVPYTGSDLEGLYGRVWGYDELPARLAMCAICGAMG